MGNPLTDTRLQALAKFYTQHLRHTMLPFWLERAPDREQGGFFTCFTPDGVQLASTDKFTWSQGRVAWLFSRMATSPAQIFSDAERAEFLSIARSAANFLLKHCIRPDGCYFVTTRDGSPKEHAPGLGLCPSTFADVFVVLGLAYYAAASRDSRLLDKAIDLFYQIEQKAADQSFRTAPYIVDPGMRLAIVPMYILNLTNELRRACKLLGDSRAGLFDSFAVKYGSMILDKFRQPGNLVLEQLGADLNPADSFLGRYTNPGHSVEIGWFILEGCISRGDKTNADRAVSIIKRAVDSGGDSEFGGIFYYVDVDGMQPRGRVVTEADASARPQYDRDWSNKLWWPHTEALYALLLAYWHTGDDWLLERFLQLHDYTFKTFPNPDESIGEWIQLRDRQGRPLHDDVGGRLPVKDPYHANRNLLMLIELLSPQAE